MSRNILIFCFYLPNFNVWTSALFFLLCVLVLYSSIYLVLTLSIEADIITYVLSPTILTRMIYQFMLTQSAIAHVLNSYQISLALDQKLFADILVEFWDLFY